MIFEVPSVLISSVVCVKTCKYFILTKRKIVKWKIMENLEKTAFIELCFFFIDLLAFELGRLCPGVEICVSFFANQGAGVLH